MAKDISTEPRLPEQDPLAVFAAAWESAFPHAPPVSCLMRDVYAERWFRIHSLPGSKRYPENEAEYAELLTRHNAVATALFGNGTPVMLVLQQYRFLDDDERMGMAMPFALPAEPRFLRRVESAELEPDADPVGDMAIELRATPVEWRAGGFDPMIRAAADDRSLFFLITALDAARVYAPYDGGADIYVEDRATRDVWKRRYSTWLSSHPGGL